LRGQGKLTEEHLDLALAEIRDALLEATSTVGVADKLLANIRATKHLGSNDAAAAPDQQVSRFVRDDCSRYLGKHAQPLFAFAPAFRCG